MQYFNEFYGYGEWIRFSGFNTEISKITFYRTGRAKASSKELTWKFPEHYKTHSLFNGAIINIYKIILRENG